MNKVGYIDVSAETELRIQETTDLAATRMRDACVAKVREMRSEWAGNEVWIDAADEIITALESLTLDSVQKDQPT